MGRFVRPIVAMAVAVAALLAFGATLTAAEAARVASAPAQPIGEAEAVAAAMKALPGGGKGYRVVGTQLEPTSEHFEWSGPNGSGFGEDQVRECLVIPPLPPVPWFSPCRYYPVWLVALSSGSCNEIVAVNALTGRFGGGGGDCEISPFGDESDFKMWQPTWG